VKRPARNLAGLLVLAFFVWAIGHATDAQAHYQPGAHNAIHAINLVWCGKSNTYCAEGNKAARVARCEASARYWYTRPQDAKNGQYLGMFQMGEWARGEYGHGPSVWHQARAAYKNWKDNGWQNQWECAVLLGIR
jgi:hypothetical protein